MAMWPGSAFERAFVEGLGDVPHRARDAHLLAVGGGDAGALLAAMLQRIEAEIRQVGRFGMPEDAKDAALVLELVDACRSLALLALGRGSCMRLHVRPRARLK